MNITGIESRQVHSTSMTCYFLDLKKISEHLSKNIEYQVHQNASYAVIFQLLLHI